VSAEVVEAGKLLEVVGFGLGATIGVALLFSLAILSTVRALERQRPGGVSLAWGALAAVCFAGVLAAAGYGLILLSSK
jgi:hypothetical protein